MKNRILVTTAGVACLVVGAHSFAKGDRQFPISLAEMENRVAERFVAMDSDASGDIDLDEFANSDFGPGRKADRRRHGAKKHFPGKGRMGPGRMSGRLSPEERQARMSQVESEIFRLMDSDQDGAVSAQEFSSADKRAIRKQAHKRIRFADLDTDSDGVLSRDELPNPVARMSVMDTDGDGLITREEMRTARQSWRDAKGARDSNG